MHPREAIERLLAAHGPKLYALGLNICRSREEAEDLVQDVFVQAFRKWPQFRGESSPMSWLYTIAARTCRRRHRRRAGEPRRVIRLSDVTPFTESRTADRPDTAAGRAEARERVQSAIAGLPAEYRLPLIFKDVLELSVGDAAAALGLKEATLKTRTHRARLALRKAMLRGRATRPAPPPIYDRTVCLDLLGAQLAAQDRGRGFPIGREVLCERCRGVFSELNEAQSACAELARGNLPAGVRRAILTHIRADSL
jgi:RNA polymerase sigma-70 factor (ECF subfamily)